HLSDSYGYTVDNIEKDGIPIIAKIETLIDSSSKSARVKSLSILLQDCIHSVTMYNPDLIIYAGDREDVIVAGIIGSYLRIPTVHFFGGDHASDGNVDNSIRHATSKLSSLHFVSNNKAKSRLIKMG
ncbi:UDP-N-acetylglucosamine 2-epimerase, partial [Clostridium perfringens]